jgi:enoyl-CoA hydratase/carnithine racemase
MADEVLYERDGPVVTITMNRPDSLNAINGPMRQGLNRAWTRFVDDTDAWVAVVTGRGRAFCAGADLEDPAGAVGTWPGSFWEIPTLNSMESGWEIWKPTIAAVNGPCIGYGLTGALACDFVMAAESATFGYPEVTLGVPTIVGALRLPPRVGWSEAMELLLTGDPIDAARAHEIGLAWRVVPDDELTERAVAFAHRLTRGAPLAQRATKEMARRSGELPWIDAVRMGETMRRLVAASEDATEGVAARREGRDPDWKAR